MIHLFHLITIFFIIKELIWISSPNDMIENKRRLEELQKSEKGKDYKDHSTEFKSLLKKTGLTSFVILIWMIFGLMTFNWVLFLAILLFNILIIRTISKPFKYSKIYTAIHWVNSIIGLSFGVFVLINHYHLRIDMFKVLMEFFNH